MPSRSKGRPRRREKKRAQRVRRRERERRGLSQRLAELGADFALVGDPGSPPTMVAAALERIYGGRPPPLEMAEDILMDFEEERGRAVVEAGLEGRGSLVGLTLAADLAMIYDEDAAAAELLLREALELDAAREPGPDPMLLSRLAMALGDLDRAAEAARVARQALTFEPSDHRLEEMRGEWLEELAELGADPTAACNCRSGRRFGECCGPEAERELEFFADRGPLEEVRVAVEAFARVGAAADRVEVGLDEWVDQGALAAEAVDQPQGRNQPFVRLAVERSWMFATEPGERTILAAYAAAEPVHTELARRALEWNRSAIWGLWEVERPGNPAVTVTEYLTGLQFHAAIPAEQLEGLPPWTVLLGYLVPVDGVWRSGGAFYSLAPAEARALAEVVMDVVTMIGERADLHGEVVEWAERLAADLRSGEYLPGLVAPASGPDAESESELTAALIVVRNSSLVAFPRLVAQLRRWRASAASVIDSDREPLELFEARPGEKPAGVAQAINERRGWRPRPPPLVEAPGAPAEVEGWLSSLPDTPLEVLAGLTPRQAAGALGPEMIRLEVLLREVEYWFGLDAGARLRESLGLVVRRR